MDGAGGQVIDGGQSFDLLVAINFIIAKNGKINKQNFWNWQLRKGWVWYVYQQHQGKWNFWCYTFSCSTKVNPTCFDGTVKYYQPTEHFTHFCKLEIGDVLF